MIDPPALRPTTYRRRARDRRRSTAFLGFFGRVAP
jgi:hypothetical protein